MDKWRLEKLESEINDVDCLDKIRPFIDKNADLVVKLLLEKLAEKDNEIELLKRTRHQVCEEIRELAKNYFEMPICENCGEHIVLHDVVLTGNDLIEILDQIERGEKDE